MAMETTSFNITAVIDHFEGSFVGPADVNIIRYVNAFEELSRLFSILGMVFSFVESDVSEKRCILQELYHSDLVHYDTVEKMVLFECFDFHDVGGGRTRINKPKNRGSRTLLRLHRALAFLIKFVEGVEDTPGDSLSAPFKSAYRETLANHHSWFVRQSVTLASHTIPNRESLVKEIFGVKDEPDDEKRIKSLSKKLVHTLNKVYDRVQHIYEENELLDLP